MNREVVILSQDAAFAAAARLALEAAGAAVRVEVDAAGSWSGLKSHPPDALILDADLGRPNGYALCNKLKKDGGLRHVPLMLVSNEATARTFAQHAKLETRADAYAFKSAPAEQIAEAVLGLSRGPAANLTLVPGAAEASGSGSNRLVLIAGIVIIVFAGIRLFVHFG